MVTLLAIVAFAGLAYLFGYPLVNAITNLANKLPSYISSAETGKGWIGHLLLKYHVQRWVTQNAPKLVTYAQDFSKPACPSARARCRSSSSCSRSSSWCCCCS